MKKKLVLLFFFIWTFALKSQDLTRDGVNYTKFNSTTVHISANSCYDGNFSIPASVTIAGQSYDVTEINTNAFQNCETLTGVSFPTTVFTISAGAFNGCTSLENVTVPNTVSSLGTGVFSGCTSLTTANIQNSQTLIGDSLFYNCTSLTSVTLPQTITTIEDRAFENCTNLQSITIPSSVQRIEDFVFSRSGLTSINIPNSVTSIGANVFSNTKLISIDIPSSFDEIPSGFLAGCKDLETVNLPNTIEEINSSAFSGCSKLTSINLPNGLKEIKHSAFTSSGLTTITIPSSVTEIEYWAFRDCWDLKSVSMGNSVTTVGAGVFERCYKLTDIVLSENLSSLSGSMFRQCFQLENITIPNSVSQFSDKAFEKCSKLVDINIPNGVTSIGKNTFDGCLKLQKIEIPISVTSIDAFAFANTIIDDVTVKWETPITITENVFDNVDLSVATLNVPQNTESLYNTADVWKDFGVIKEEENQTGNGTAIPDANFEAYLESINLGNGIANDGFVDSDKIAVVTALTIENLSIADIKGIQDFTALQELNAKNNQISQVDFSNNSELEILLLADNQISTIDVSNNLKLRSLDIGANNLTEIDVHLLKDLELLSVYNNQLTEINIFSNDKLTVFVANNNQIKSIDFRENPSLFQIDLENNQLEHLVVKNGNNTAISVFNITGNTNLTCVEVDDVNYSNSNWTQKDAITNYSLDCAPANDDCTNAIPLVFGQQTPGDVNSGTANNNPSCATGNVLADVWFTVVVPETGEFSIEGTGFGGQLKFAVYTNCQSVVPIACGDGISLTNLTVGETFYLKVWLEGSSKSQNLDAGSFTLTASESSVLSVDISTIDEHQISLFPNPARDFMKVETNKNQSIDFIEVYNILGKKIFSQKLANSSEVVNLKNLNTGVYILKVSVDNKIISKKFIVN